MPYIKDTTPHWSKTGKLRNKLIQLLEGFYGDGCLNNLAKKLAEESDEARVLFNQSAIQPFMDLVEHYPLAIIFSSVPLKLICLENCFLIRTLADKLKPGWLQYRIDYVVNFFKSWASYCFCK